MYYTLDSAIVLIETTKINKYKYVLSNLIANKSIQYDIYCYDDTITSDGLTSPVFIKHITGILEGEEYSQWINDDYLDNFIKAKVIASQ